jgi:hypothetical protein
VVFTAVRNMEAGEDGFSSIFAGRAFRGRIDMVGVGDGDGGTGLFALLCT